MTLKQLRENKGLTQTEVCSKLKISTMYLWYLENGKRNPSDDLKKKLIKLYAINIEELYKAIEQTRKFFYKRDKQNV